MCTVCEWNDCFLVVHFLKMVESLMTQTCLMSTMGTTSLMEVRHQCHLEHFSIWVGLIGDLSFYSFSTFNAIKWRCFEDVVLKKSNLLPHLCTLGCSFNWTLVSPLVYLLSLLSFVVSCCPSLPLTQPSWESQESSATFIECHGNANCLYWCCVVSMPLFDWMLMFPQGELKIVCVQYTKERGVFV